MEEDGVGEKFRKLSLCNKKVNAQMPLNSNLWVIFVPIEHPGRARPVSAFLCRTKCGKCGKMAALSAESAEMVSYISTICFETY